MIVIEQDFVLQVRDTDSEFERVHAAAIKAAASMPAVRSASAFHHGSDLGYEIGIEIEVYADADVLSVDSEFVDAVAKQLDGVTIISGYAYDSLPEASVAV